MIVPADGGNAFTRLVRRLPDSVRILRSAPLRLLTAIAIAMVLASFYAASLKLERLLFGLAIDEQQITNGISLPAAAFDGHSTGVLAVSAEHGLPSPFSGYFIDVGVNATSLTDTALDIVVPYYWSELINALVVLALAAVVLQLCLRLLRGGPFVARTTASLGAFAVLLAVGSIVSQVVRHGGEASAEVQEARDGAMWAILTSRQPEELNDYYPALYTPAGEPALDLFPLGVAVLISVIAAAFWLGHRMQRDTEGLV